MCWWTREGEAELTDPLFGLQVGHVTAGKLELEPRAAGLPQYLCRNCRCLNVRLSFLADLRWRSEAWVTICATMAIIGFLLAIAIMVFISVSFQPAVFLRSFPRVKVEVMMYSVFQ